MEKPDLLRELQLTIIEMESVHKQDGIELRQSFRDVLNSFRPIQLIKETFTKVAESGKIKDSIANMLISVSAGYLSKKIVESGSKNIFKTILGTVVMFGVSSLISKNQEIIKTLGGELLNFSSPKETTDSREEPKQ
ncbi:hypothetical protein [Sediminibacterium sp.]|jgi:hypothetical protein|uniref:hypothetical protein n=1 Tax=Sediminibacterium sp. TaxID=1917865 RepID=UPI0025DAC2AA|nr:hypothetical protein [Sediminibacterium sp.]MBW0176724.1 hypothetical protein [Sediminibacterium sp.]